MRRCECTVLELHSARRVLAVVTVLLANATVRHMLAYACRAAAVTGCQRRPLPSSSPVPSFGCDSPTWPPPRTDSPTQYTLLTGHLPAHTKTCASDRTTIGATKCV